jgi:hypothetical protein
MSTCSLPKIVLSHIVLLWGPRQACGGHILVVKTDRKKGDKVISGNEKCFEENQVL